MCLRMNVVCATAISACIVWVLSMRESGSALVGGNRIFEGVCICVRMCVCVCFYYVLVGRLGIIIQAWLSTYNVVWMTQRASEKKRLECVRLRRARADLEMEFSTLLLLCGNFSLWATSLKNILMYITPKPCEKMFRALNSFVFGAQELRRHSFLKCNYWTVYNTITYPFQSHSPKARSNLTAFTFTFSEVNQHLNGPASTPRSSWRTWKGQKCPWTALRKCWKRQVSATATWTGPAWTPLTPTAPSPRPTRTQLRCGNTFSGPDLHKCAVVTCQVRK